MNEPNPNGVRVPKGILKNSSNRPPPPETVQDYGASGSGYLDQPSYGYNLGIPAMSHPVAGYHVPPPGLYPGEYGALPPGHVPPSVPHPQQSYLGAPAISAQWGQYYEGLNPQQHIQPPISDDVPTFRRKLDRFIAKKQNLILRPLSTQEKPLLESRLEEKKSEGSYGVTPSLDNYLPLESSDRIKEFFRTVQVGDIVVGEVYSKSSSGLTFRLLCNDGGKRAYLEDLSMKGVCPASQVVPLDPADPDKVYEEDDRARLEVLEVNYDSKKLVLGMKGIKISNDIRHAFPLGPIANDDLPRDFIMTNMESKSRRRRSYEQVLDNSSGFHNPNSVACLATSLGILSNKNSLMLGLCGSYAQKDMAKDLRSAQNAKWAQQNVALGIRHFKQGNQVEAFQCLNKAIIIDPQNVEGLVARGALYANNGSFEKAMEDFEAALKNAPEHFNGRKYMAETLIVVGKNKQEEGKIEDAFASYAKSLSTLPEHKDAILSLMSVHEQLEKVDINRLSGTALNKVVEVKEKLRTMIAEEIAKKKLGYYDKGSISASNTNVRVKREHDSSESESSSSNSSDSESGSSTDGEHARRDKKKKPKKRKKKHKKSRKNSRSSKAASLSPFSKKMAGSELGGSGLGGSNYPDWSQQIGINKIAGGSDEESQRSSKKGKEKKRSKKRKEKRKKKKRESSTSSGSDSPEKKAKKDKPKVITDFGEIEEQLTAFFSKCDQGKSDTRSDLHIPPQAVKVTVKQDVYRERGSTENSSRRIELVNDDLKSKESRFSYKNDEGYLQSQHIVRTVQNDQSTKGISATSSAVPPTNASGSDLAPVAKPPTSKWRTIGSTDDTSYSLSTLGPVLAPKVNPSVKPAPTPVSTAPAVTRELPFAVSLDKLKPKELDSKPGRHYRSRSRSRKRSRSRSRSVSRHRSRSRSRSPGTSPRYRRIRRNRSRSGSRRRSFSRSRSRSGSRPRHRSRSSFPRRFRGGHGGNRFQRGHGGRRGKNPRQFPPVVRISRFRNRFNKSCSRSKSRSGSRGRKTSRSPDRKRQEIQGSSSKHRSPIQQSKSHDASGKKSKDYVKQGGGDGVGVKSKGTSPSSSRKSRENVEMHVLGLSTNKVSDVEKLLDKHKAQKKEEMRENHPEFFRNP